jgi:heme-degrading monooxygenase HmoA
MGRIASFHLVSESAWRAPVAMARLGTDRLRVGRVPGLVFWRLLGTGRRDEPALDEFLGHSTIGRRWSDIDEAWHVRLRGLGGHGSWRGVDPLEGLEVGVGDGPIAVVTRADVRPGAWRSFGRAGRVVDDELHRADGLIEVVGIGEAPLGRLATFSLWESLAAAREFAYSMPDHVAVVQRTRAEHWYSEELFARFEPYASTGRWNGRDPLRRA